LREAAQSAAVLSGQAAYIEPSTMISFFTFLTPLMSSASLATRSRSAAFGP
jgi:hypothetical protein